TLMLDIGITLPFGQLTSLWRRPALLIRSLLAVLVLVPGVVLLLLWLLDLPRAVGTGLAVLAAAPGAPLTTMRSQMAGGSTPYSGPPAGHGACPALPAGGARRSPPHHAFPDGGREHTLLGQPAADAGFAGRPDHAAHAGDLSRHVRARHGGAVVGWGGQGGGDRAAPAGQA